MTSGPVPSPGMTAILYVLARAADFFMTCLSSMMGRSNEFMIPYHVDDQHDPRNLPEYRQSPLPKPVSGPTFPDVGAGVRLQAAKNRRKYSINGCVYTVSAARRGNASAVPGRIAARSCADVARFLRSVLAKVAGAA